MFLAWTLCRQLCRVSWLPSASCFTLTAFLGDWEHWQVDTWLPCWIVFLASREYEEDRSRFWRISISGSPPSFSNLLSIRLERKFSFSNRQEQTEFPQFFFNISSIKKVGITDVALQRIIWTESAKVLQKIISLVQTGQFAIQKSEFSLTSYFGYLS